MITYADYLAHCDSDETLMVCSGKNKEQKNRKPVKEKRFNRLRDEIKSVLDSKQYSTREEARVAAEYQIQKMDPVSFFLLRLFIGWLITKLLDASFK